MTRQIKDEGIYDESHEISKWETPEGVPYLQCALLLRIAGALERIAETLEEANK